MSITPHLLVNVYMFWVPVEKFSFSDREPFLVPVSLDSLIGHAAGYPQPPSKSVILLCQKKSRFIAINPQVAAAVCFVGASTTLIKRF